METIKILADMLCISAKTAPKAKGVDNIVTKVIYGDDKEKLAEKMDKIAVECDHLGFARDAKGIRSAECVVLIGTKLGRMNLKVCGNCGYKNCAENEKNNSICAFNPGDLGIAIGSAVSKAADFRLDNRIMYTAGNAAKKLNMLGEQVKMIYAVPLSATGKNPFFDRT
ncbi:ferredoxin domain-containing protein [bacterium]